MIWTAEKYCWINDNNMKKNLKLICIFITAAIICFAIWQIRKNSSDGGTVVIEQNGKVVYQTEFKSVTDTIEYKIASDNGGYNVVNITADGVEVTDADCPDKICVKQGKINNSAVPVVCLPHKLVVYIKDAESDFDAVAGDR